MPMILPLSNCDSCSYCLRKRCNEKLVLVLDETKQVSSLYAGGNKEPDRTLLVPPLPVMLIAVMDRAAPSRTVAQQIQCVRHHSVSARTIQRHLQQSGKFTRRSLLRLPLTGNHRRLRRQCCDERWIGTME
ncbi:transposable element Tcb1 transposase [Trichonephila clavipes]|nr:transposable element Tcb1 transposase [Trichonephila clavipes]